MYHGETMVWPLQPFDASPCKLLHEFQFGGLVSAKQLSHSTDEQKRLQTELLVWGISISLDEFSQLGFSVDKVRFFGVQWHPEQFLNKACEVDHPLDPAAALPEVLSEAISLHARQGLHAVAKRRVEFFMRWNARAAELQETEKTLRKKWTRVWRKRRKGRRLCCLRIC